MADKSKLKEPLLIEIHHYGDTCGDGCCSIFVDTISINGKRCKNKDAGDDVVKSLEFVLNELGFKFTIEEHRAGEVETTKNH